MSMKVYDACNVKDSKNVWTLLWALKEQLGNGIEKRLKSHYWELMIDINPESEEYKKKEAQREHAEDWAIRLDLAHKIVRDRYKEVVTRPERDRYNLEVTIGVYPHKGQYYLRAFHD